ncbi:hypothetical protein MRX96_005631 [Rhipicephalus microplus]
MQRNSPRALCVKARAKKEQPQAVECVRASLNWNAVSPPLSHHAAPPFQPAVAGGLLTRCRGGADGLRGGGRQQTMPRASAGCLAHSIHRSRGRAYNKTTVGEQGVRGGLRTVSLFLFCQPAVSNCCFALAKKRKKKGSLARR